MMLLPEAMQEWLPEGHLAYFIGDAVAGLDLSAFHARYEKDGPRNQPFHPAMMVKVLLYGYATGVFSSRKIARKLHEDVAFRVLGARNFPAHRTIRDFRALHLKELGDLFVQVVRLAREMGLVKLGTIAVDGTKAKSADEAEKNEPELDIPAEIARRQDRPDAIAAARARLEQRQRDEDIEKGRSDDDDRRPRGKDGKPEGGRYKQPVGVPDDRNQENFTDPDSGIMKHAGGASDASYNGQTAVDDKAHIIVAAELVNIASDVQELPTMLEAVKANLGAHPEQTRADAGYRSEAVLDELADKMRTDPARKAYRRRKHIAEPPNGRIKSILGFRQFRLRGMHRAQAEWKLVCMALNLRRMATLTTR
jgi:transposase